jgi:hypothetical protein
MRRRPKSDSDPLGIVGWVFADLMLVLVLVFMGTQLGNPNAGAKPKTVALMSSSTTTSTLAPTTTTTTTTLAPTTTTTTTTTTTPTLGIESGYVCIVVPEVATGAAFSNGTISDPERVIEETRARLTSETWPYRDRKLGMVLVWGIANANNRKPARALAEQFKDEVLPALIDLAPAGIEEIPSRVLWHGMGGRVGSILLDVYFVAEPDLPNMARVPPGNVADWRAGTDPGDCDTNEAP